MHIKSDPTVANYSDSKQCVALCVITLRGKMTECT